MPEILPDTLRGGLALVFCGTAPSPVSATAGAYYANPGNQFWRALHSAGMTPRLYAPSQFRQLLRLGIGLTDVAKCVAAVDRDLRPGDFDTDSLRQKISRYQPRILAFTSKAAFRAGAGRPARTRIEVGWQDISFGETRVFVLPSPSGAARGSWNIAPWHELAAAYRDARNGE